MHTSTAADLASMAHRIGHTASRRWDSKGVMTVRFTSRWEFHATLSALQSRTFLSHVDPRFAAQMRRALDRIISRDCPESGFVIAE